MYILYIYYILYHIQNDSCNCSSFCIFKNIFLDIECYDKCIGLKYDFYLITEKLNIFSKCKYTLIFKACKNFQNN